MFNRGIVRGYQKLSTLINQHRTRIPGLTHAWRWRTLAAVVIIAAACFVLLGGKEPAQALPCPCNVFTATPSPSNDTDSGGIEVGFKFKADVNGYITGIRFFKTAVMTGGHTVNLWDLNGNLVSTAVSSGETASGWQEVALPTPVAITANTTYTASIFAADGRYPFTSNFFGSEVVNFPLRAMADGSATDGLGNDGQGVFNTGNSSAYPQDSFNATNYWVDVTYRGNLGTSAPTVTTTDPVSAATGVNPAQAITATFDDSMDTTTLTTAAFGIKDSDSNPVVGAVSYDAATKTASFIADDGFEVGENYTATLEGGTGTVITNMEGVALATDYSWSFTVASTNPCPCTLKGRANPSGSTPIDEASSVELGVKVKPVHHGYITAIRFYKPITSTVSTHTGNIWDASGNNLATVTFSNETDYGWQEARLNSPLEVTAGQLYVISYYSSDGVYQATVGAMSSNMGGGDLIAYANDSTENAATGSGNRNGAFRSGSAGYPNSGSSSGNYYWIDALFTSSATPDYALDVTVTQPTADTIGAPHNRPITAVFNRAIDGATVTNASFRLFDASSSQVSGTGSYNSAKGEATFTPSGNLTHGGRYTARLSASIADDEGVTLGGEHSWSFTVGSQLLTDPKEGPGGPILVITTSTNKYGTYYAEILRTEGLNYFDVKDISTVDAATLNNYQAVVLSEMTLTQPQADMVSAWVNTGGNLIAMRPDSKLASILGLASAGTTRSNQYLLVDDSSVPGAGIVDETIQFKGTADNYTPSGATTVATLYSDATTSTSNPAVTTRQVGSNGGTAAAFAYDLAQSVVAMHQGNQAWAGQNRDGVSPIRTNDLFFGNMGGDSQPDWVDLNKLHIPQADEQQRLLANMLIEATKDLRPMPRFWYLPGDHKAAIVFAGDDHGLANVVGTERIFSDWLQESTTDCSAADWECVRASHYIYDSAALTDARALQFHNAGFGLGDHVENACQDYASFAALGAVYTSELNTWRGKYTSIPNQTTHRFHCYAWSDWDSQIRAAAANGIRFDLGYVAYPQSWVNSRAPLLTGSGMNMRFTDADGDLMDVYQGVTNLDNTAANSTSIAILLDNAIGASGYYGIFGTHYDMNDNYEDTLFTAAKARNIPVISSEQALMWQDGRGSSTFSNFTGGDGQFGFTISTAVGANNLKAMLPRADAGGTLSSMTLAGNAVTYQTQTVKGVQYAVFDAIPGTYTATYSDYTPPDTGGGDSGDSSEGSGGSAGSGGSSVGSGSTGKSKKSDGTTVFESGQPESTTPETSAPSTEEQPTTSKEGGEKSTPQDDTASSGSWFSRWLPWILIFLGVLLAAAGLIFVLKRRSRPQWN